jgi:hypothetical protein
MALELSNGATAAIGGLSPEIQRKLAKTGVSDASVKKWNLAGATAAAANDAAGADDSSDLPATWGLATAA